LSLSYEENVASGIRRDGERVVALAASKICSVQKGRAAAAPSTATPATTTSAAAATARRYRQEGP
jgi:hypothetical protein